MIKNRSHDYVTLGAVCFALFLGAVVRFYPALLAGFPVNDGGMFYQMTQDILNNQFALPLYTSYNGNIIPFGYPPLPFYILAINQRFLNLGIIDQLRFLPALFSTLCIPALYFLSKRITGSKVQSIFAAFAYALFPQSYLWLIMGGGVTRSLGILFGILALIFIWQMVSESRWIHLLLAIIFSSLTIYSHLGYSWFIFLSSLLILFRFGLSKKRVLYTGLTALGILLLTSPWWVTMIYRYGIALFFTAIQAGNFLDFSIILFNFTGEPYVQVLAVIALLGLFAEIARRRYFFFAWLLLITILSARGGPRLAAIPGSMLFGSGVIWVLVPGLLSLSKRIPEEAQSLSEIMRPRIIKTTLGVIIIYAFISAVTVPLLGLSETRTLSQYDRQSMQWVSQNTAPGSQFTILTGERWITDPMSEWFPALSGRTSTTTVQGSEWLPDNAYNKKRDIYEQLQLCIDQDFSCVNTWSTQNKISFAYLCIHKMEGGRKGASPAEIELMKSSANLKLIFDNPGVSIFQVVGE